MTSRRSFLGFVASLPFIGLVHKTKHIGIKKFDCSQLYCSPKALEDIRNWGVHQIDEAARKEIYSAGTTHSIYGVNRI